MAIIPRQVQKILVTIFGGLTILIGLALSLPLVPGPGLLLVFLGIALLATEYQWAKQWRDWMHDLVKRKK